MDYSISLRTQRIEWHKGTYKYKGEWDSLDHIFVSEPLKKYWLDCFIMMLIFFYVMTKNMEENSLLGAM